MVLISLGAILGALLGQLAVFLWTFAGGVLFPGAPDGLLQVLVSVVGKLIGAFLVPFAFVVGGAMSAQVHKKRVAVALTVLVSLLMGAVSILAIIRDPDVFSTSVWSVVLASSIAVNAAMLGCMAVDAVVVVRLGEFFAGLFHDPRSRHANGSCSLSP